MTNKVGQIEIKRLLRIDPQRKRRLTRRKGNYMGGTGNKSEPPKKTDDKSKKPAPAPVVEADDDEDGDIATPKRDRSGNDDEPL
jgi:hypothetical protein